MFTTVLTLFALPLLIIVEILRSLPAWLRVLRTRSVDGLSPISLGILLGSAWGWLLIAWLAHTPVTLVATMVWLVLHVLLCITVVRLQPRLSKPLLASAGCTLAGVVACDVLGMLLNQRLTVLAGLLTIVTACYILPALVAGMRSQTTAGLSGLTLTVNSIEGIIYVLLGFLGSSGQPILAYITFGSLALVGNLPRLVRVTYRRVHALA